MKLTLAIKRSSAVGTYCAVQGFNNFSISDHSFNVNDLFIPSDKKHSFDLFMSTNFTYEKFTNLVITDSLTISA